ncbi:hypothetical protein Aspvir_000283 [Aspergillus viridinutans]|uniref:Uncharacterized protein n=1 Tax=Aspergillus viridinutans TaxID=75553 RepID=A0A9P3EYH4_ASPVI|nr:uncharacterized protein Aspvir_000283 [Aspergillus viridinutans]GIJ98168.1 hypothetical protein Aspvir_000283 [Aspergillus viridinutans]
MWYVMDLLLLAGAVAYALRPPQRATLEETVQLHASPKENNEVPETISERDDEASDNVSETSTYTPPEREARSLEDWLVPVPDATWHHHIRKTRQDKTGEGLLASAKFQKWFATDGATLLCTGLPGTGKTVLASAVIDYLQDKLEEDASVGVAFLYCSARDYERRKPIDLLWSLLRQFVQKSPKVLPETLQLFYKSYKLQKPPRLAIEDVSKAMQIMVREYSRAFVVIDALDEYDWKNDELHTFLDVIVALQAQTGLNLLATSRHAFDAGSRFYGCLSLTIRASDNDIWLYLQNHMARLPPSVRDNPYLLDNIKDDIVHASNGVFLLARLNLSCLESSLSTDEINAVWEQIRAKRPNGLTEADVLDTIARACSRAIDKIKRQAQGSRSLAERTLEWLSCARTPLKLSGLKQALASELPAFEGTEAVPAAEDIVSVCAGLVTVDIEADTVSFLHCIIHEHFEQNWRLYFPNAEDSLTKVCITHLTKVFQSEPSHAEDQIEESSQQNAFTIYAAKTWGYHARASPAEATEDLVHQFLRADAAVAGACQAMGLCGGIQPDNTCGVHLAAYFGLEKAMAALLKDGHSPDTKALGGKTPLLLAAEMGHKAVFALLLKESGVRIECKDSEHGQTPIISAARHGHGTIVKLLLEHGANPESTDGIFNQTALSWAVKNGHTEVVKLLLNHNARIPCSRVEFDPKWLLGSEAGFHDAFVQEFLAGTPLISAAWNGHVSMVLLLLEHGCDLETRDSIFGQTVLSWAAWKGREGVVRLLLEKQALTDTHDKLEMTPLHYAALNGHAMIVRELLESGADIECRQDHYDCTPLSLAAWTGRQAVVQLLLDKGADLQGGRALEWALDNGPEINLRFLIKGVEYRRDPASCSQSDLEKAEPGDEHLKVFALLCLGRFDPQETVEVFLDVVMDQLPALWGIWSRQGDMLKLLMGKGASIPLEQGIESDKTVLAIAAERGFETLLSVLIEQGADIEVRDAVIGKTPLHFAAENGHHILVKILLDNGADIEAQDILFGQTPLLWAAEKGHTAVVKLLLDRGAQIEAIDEEHGQTPLLLAAKNGHGDAVKCLLEMGANTECRDTQHSMTPLDWAIKNGYGDVEKLLKQQSVERPTS